MNSGTRVALYLRTSTGKQTVKNQQRELEAVAKRHGWQIVETFVDAGVSGMQERRPGLDALKTGIMRKAFDLVAVWSVDRLGRSMPQLARFLELLQQKGIHLYDHQHGIDTTTKFGEAFFYMAGIFAGVERAMIVDRIHVGLRRARAEGKRLGRPRISTATEAQIREALRRPDASIRSVVELTAASHGTVQRVRASMK